MHRVAAWAHKVIAPGWREGSRRGRPNTLHGPCSTLSFRSGPGPGSGPGSGPGPGPGPGPGSGPGPGPGPRLGSGPGPGPGRGRGRGQGQGQGRGQGRGWGQGWKSMPPTYLVAVVNAKPAQKRPALHSAQCVTHGASHGVVHYKAHCMVHRVVNARAGKAWPGVINSGLAMGES